MRTPKTKRRKFKYAPLDASPGTKVVLWKPQNGHKYQSEQLKKLGLVKYREYTIEKTIIHGFSTEFYLLEYPGVSFNSVHFGIAL